MHLTTSAFFGSVITRHALSIVAWAWIVWNYIHHLPVEYEKVWKPAVTERRPSFVATVYVFIRYIGLTSQTANLLWTAWLLSSLSIDPSMCLRWFWFQSIAIQVLFSAVQYVVMLRVDTLYFKDWRVRILLLVCWLFERALLLHVALETSRVLKLDTTCLSGQSPVHASLGLIFAIVAIQLIVLGLTLAGLYAVGWSKSPLTRQLIRDGAVICISIIAFYTVIVPYRFYVDVLSHNIFALMISLLCNVGCRIILNLLSLPGNEASKPPHTGTSTWCLDTLEASVVDIIEEDSEVANVL
ncbi:hypothetical protein FPV67DRAFT_300859 [Lyophyllum atratum]|nr:hypothetical protein FPV67DRAFT_300859 [Lyophyllum atratum]